MKVDHKHKNVLKKFETLTVKITVEELYNNHFIATRWFKLSSPETSRAEFKFKTYEQALNEAFDLVVAVVPQKVCL